MKILYTPNMICPAIPAEDQKRILELAGPGSVLIEARDAATQRKEIADTDVVFGRVPNDVFVGAKRLRYYHSIGAGVDAILTPELVASDVILASEKGEVGIHLAEHAFALLLTLTRGIHTALRQPDFTLPPAASSCGLVPPAAWDSPRYCWTARLLHDRSSAAAWSTYLRCS